MPNSSSSRSCAPEVFTGIFILACASTPFFGFHNVFSTDGFMGIFWQGFIASAAIAVGVPLAMRINRQNREEERHHSVNEFCVILHLYLQGCINQADRFLFFMRHNTAPPPLSLEFFEQPEWLKRHALITNRQLVYVMQEVKAKIEFFNAYLSPVNPLSEADRDRWLVYVGDLCFGMDLNEEFREILKAGNPLRQPVINDGMNRDFICLMYSLQNFMTKNKIPFEKWNEERIEAVLELQKKSPRFLPGQEGSDCVW